MTAPLVYKYQADNEDGSPQKIGWCPSVLNAYQMPVVPARIVPADYVLPENPDDRPNIDNRPKYVFEAGKPFQVIDGSELHQFVRSSQLFRRVPATEYQVSGSGEVLLVDNPEAPRIPVPPAPDREPLNEDEVRGPTNSTWAALEEVSSAQLMRHSHTGGKRGGNER
jgi:hypothetical protein